MGFFGFVVAARTADPDGLDAGLGPAFNTDDLGDGWQVFQAEGNGAAARLARAVAQRTGAPALAAYVLDSDCAILAAAAAGETWQVAVRPEVLEDYGPPDEDDLLSGPEAVEALVAWAQAAGFDPDPAAVEEALDSDETFAEFAVAEVARTLIG
ncbi:hypothetical protein [Dactylosporangium sp. CA-092794]|uniref:hypothetical protein n=1 Tax=Dactylosporangium sp. CA-092794 TaxID=3239929 RepID=UPI003D926CCA